jgi:aerobic-type carbon monoxide dehydrogenase small subunit (CoxS/CutS family)
LSTHVGEHGADDLVTIVVDGEERRVPANTTVAVALLGLGVRAFRRSVSGEPRAPLCAMGICFECRVDVDGVADRRACLIPVVEGLLVRTAAERAT